MFGLLAMEMDIYSGHGQSLLKSIRIRRTSFHTSLHKFSQWLGQVKSLPGEHYVVNNTYAFYSRYMSTMPHSMLIDPEANCRC